MVSNYQFLSAAVPDDPTDLFCCVQNVYVCLYAKTVHAVLNNCNGTPISFVIAASLRARRELIDGQDNTPDHDPPTCYQINEHTTIDMVRICRRGIINGTTNPNQCDPDLATFSHAGAASWMWVVGPLALYFLERIIRIWRSWSPCIVTRVSNLSSLCLAISVFTRCAVVFLVQLV